MLYLKSSPSFVPFAEEDLNHSIAGRFQKQVRLYPDRIAVKASDRVLTYTALNQAVNQIAWAILAQQGSQSEPVALLFESGVDMIVAMLGVLKAGKFYVPLDASLPQTRLNYILDDSQASLVLTNHKFVGLANELCLGQVSILNIDQLEAGLSIEDLNLELAPNALAYVIYTSGSTGQPKGVIQTHRYVLNLTRTYSNSGQICADDRLALLYSPSFGGAVRDIFCALLNGATLLPFDIKQEGLAELGQWLNQEAITVFFAVATMFRHFASSLRGGEQFPFLRMIQIGSETVYKQDVDLYQQYFSDDCVLVVNLGGTEISPIRQFFVNQTTVIEGSTVPAGYAVEGVEVLLLDEQGQPVEENQIGEIVVKSCDVALGYWNKPDLTAATFLPAPQSHARLYKTGDLGRLLPDGCLLHLGRKDFQVKIRGYRVEVTEVEMTLLQCDQIREAAVISSPDHFGDQRLVAYFVPTDPQLPPSARQLRRLLADRLPDYMVPSVFIELAAFPLGANGKLDRRALSEPDQLTRSQQGDFIAPRNSIEQRLAAIWSQVLNIDPISIKDHFFELGGHSLQASQVIARIVDVFSIYLPLKAIFEFPTIAQLATQIRDTDTSTQNDCVALKPIARSDRLLLSLPQQRLWFLHQLEANKAVYTVCRAFRLTGQLDGVCLERAIQTIIERHEILRTTFKVVDGSPVQAIASSLPFTLSVVDLQDLPAAERLSKADQTIVEIQNHPFDLTQAPLLRVVWIQLDHQDHRLLVTMHHIITDDWSMQVFLRELSVLYTAFLQGHPSPLHPLTIQYADYANWQRQWLTGNVLDNQLNYWQQQLADAPPVLDLPTDFPRTSEPCFQVGVVPFCLDQTITQRLKALSQRSQTTLFITLLTAFAALLSRYSNQEDIVIGTGIANRSQVVTEQLIGFFVSTLALRIKLLNNPTFLDLLTQVHQTALDAYAHSDVPFDRLVEALQIERHLSHSPLFQVMFLLQNVAQEKLTLPGIEAELLEFAQPTAGATFDLTLSLKETAEGLQGTLEYNAKRFERTTITRMATHFQTLLTAIVETPEQPVGFLPLLTPSERDSCFTGQSAAQDSASECLHQWFEVQVEQTPDAISVCCGNQQLTYRELNERANQLAHYLQPLGVKPDTLVGICIERSLDMIVGLLGILKAGGAYVPLDPTYPKERLAYVIDDAQVRILVTQSGLVDKLPPCKPIVEQVVCLDTDWMVIAQQSSENFVSEVQLQNLAYVIYTSGSTGQPKGVLVSHYSVARLFTATESWYHFNKQDVWTLFHSYAFDFSVWELWGALLYGGRLVVVPYWTSRDTAAFYDLLISEQVTVLNQTPSAFYQLIKVDARANAKHNLRLIIFGGEALDLPSLKPWFDRHGDRQPQLVNMYGITETTVHVTYRPLSLADVNATENPIGVPIPDVQIYLLDQYQQPVPRGVRGEMYVGGGGVSQGYLNRADLTNDRFIPNPLNHSTVATQNSKLYSNSISVERVGQASSLHGQDAHPTNHSGLLYKTGDLAKLLPSGELAYLGRIDDQVKIRGFRIELGEIEAILSQHPAIGESGVLVQADQLGDKRLVAYVVPSHQSSDSLKQFIQDIRHYLKQKLPEYMVPAAIVVLEAFPLTANGKIAHHALPAPENIHFEFKDCFVPPTTLIETTLADLWAEILPLSRIGIHDNFFDLGGHSLLATSLVFRIRQAFAIDFPLRCLFETPTIAALSKLIESFKSHSTLRLNGIPATMPAMSCLERNPSTPVPISLSQQSLWLLHQSAKTVATLNSSTLMRVRRSLSPDVVEQALNEIVRRHENLRTVFTVINDQPMQVVLPHLHLPLVYENLQHLPLEVRESEAVRLGIKVRQQPFNLAVAPLIRAALFQLNPEDHWLVITMHHIITDGWSFGVLLQELDTLIQALANGRPSPLPALSCQYADFALWQQQVYNETAIAQQLSYWQRKLVDKELDPSPSLMLSSKQAGHRFISLPESLVRSIERLGCSQKVTSFVILLSAFKLVLAKWSQQNEILILATLGNRTGPDTERMIGCFINDAILRSLILPEQTGSTVMQQLQTTVNEAIEHKEVPLDRVINQIKPLRPLNLLGIITMTPSVQDKMPDWEAIPPEQWGDMPIELYGRTPPLELYIELSKTIRVRAKYGTEKFTAETIDHLLNNYQEVLTKLVNHSEMTVSDLFKTIYLDPI